MMNYVSISNSIKVISLLSGTRNEPNTQYTQANQKYWINFLKCTTLNEKNHQSDQIHSKLKKNRQIQGVLFTNNEIIILFSTFPIYFEADEIARFHY